MADGPSSFADIARVAVEQSKTDNAASNGDSVEPRSPSPSVSSWPPSGDDALTSPTTDVAPSKKIPSTPGIPGPGSPARETRSLSPQQRPSPTTAQSTPHLSSLGRGTSFALSLPHFHSKTNGNGDSSHHWSHTNGDSSHTNGNGRIAEEEDEPEREGVSSSAKEEDAPADVASSHKNAGGPTVQARDFAANATGPKTVKTLAGGGKAVRNQSFVSIMGRGKSTKSRDRELTDSPDEVPVGGIPPTGGFFPIPSSFASRHPAPPVRSQTLPISQSPLKRSNSLPYPAKSASGPAGAREAGSGTPTGEAAGGGAKQKWSHLKQKLQRKQTGAVPLVEEKMAAPMRLTDELLGGALGVVMLKMDIDRDEKGRKRVPVFLHHVRFKISDSIGGSGNHPVFRIECDYGDGRVKWVLYRNLRDFLSLHAHYKAAKLQRFTGRSSARGAVELPEFPKSSIPYFQRKKKDKDGGDKSDGDHISEKNVARNPKGKGKEISKPNFAEAQRTALQNYLLTLVRAVMLRPESNRLIRFFELSALTLQLAKNPGGTQGKSGFLRVLNTDVSSKSARPALSLLAWKNARKERWWVVRESYLIAVEEPDQSTVFDVFPFDQDFHIERPTRVLRKGLEAVNPKSGKDRDDWGSIAEIDDDAREEIRLAALEGEIHGIDRATIGSWKDDKTATSHHTFYVNNAQGRLKLVAKNVRQMQQFILSLEKMSADSIWAGKNRFDSFAPIRLNVAAQWLVDGRDYLWSLSRALLVAKKCVYIHDWWLSPELYMRRPSQEKYRLDNILKKKASEGVKIYVIVYNEVSNKTTPTDSLYTKKTLRDLHPNIFVQRSPSHFATGTFYWSHHEKMCVIDEETAFMGGVDLCFGRWDTPQHSLVDDDFEPGTVEGERGPVWPGKDYSNPRVMDFHTLNKPMEDQYDREKVPRMPWHDIAMQMVGQPARDLCRHFSQRWNHLLRIKNHTTAMPFLVPPPDFSVKELTDRGLTGTCEVQVCRSCGPWSMGTANRIEHSIQNAYLKAIQMSEHFIYIENQFFITSTVVDGIVIENRIGDALVNRIIKARDEGTEWRACIVIPTLPGYTHPIDSDAASSVRLIVECQNKSICRGPNSIFGRLRQEGIDPDEYISFFSLRGWGKFKDGTLTTEMVYIHAKTMIVDDRLAIIGSANINERSMRGDRDSELASVIRDTDMIDSTMAGKPYKVGRFAHTLRIRLMREHLGVDVDEMEEDDLLDRDAVLPEDQIQVWDPSSEQQGPGQHDEGLVSTQTKVDQMWAHATSIAHSVTHGQAVVVNRTVAKLGEVFRSERDGEEEAKLNEDVEIFEMRKGEGGKDDKAQGFSSSVVASMEERRLAEHGLIDGPLKRDALGDIANTVEDATEGKTKRDVSEADAKKIVEPPIDSTLKTDEARKVKKGLSADESLPTEGPAGRPASRNSNGAGSPTPTKVDDGPPSAEGASKERERKSSRGPAGRRSGKNTHPWEMPLPTPKIDPMGLNDPLDETFWKETWVAVAVHNTEIHRKVFRCIPDDLVTSWSQYRENVSHAEKFGKPSSDHASGGHGLQHVMTNHGGGGSGGGTVGNKSHTHDEPGGDGGGTAEGGSEGGLKRVKSASTSKGGAKVPPGLESLPLSAPTEGWNDWEKEKMEGLLGEVRGHLVVYPTRFLEAEDTGKNFLFNSDLILPLQIYA